MKKQSLITFPNNFRLIVSNKDTRAVAIVLSICYGTENEPARQSGISNVIEKLIAIDLSKQVSKYGGEISSRSSVEHLEITISTYRENLSKLLTALSRAVFDFNPKVDHLEEVKKRVLQSIEKYKNSPLSTLERLTLKNLYARVGISNHPVGTPAVVTKLTVEDTREYLSKIIGPNSMNLTIVGDVGDRTESEAGVETTYNEVYSLVMELFYAKLIKYKNPKPKFSEAVTEHKSLYSEKTKILFQDRFLLALPAYAYNSANYKYARIVEDYVGGYLKKALSRRENIYGFEAKSNSYRNNGHMSLLFAVDEDAAVEAYNFIIENIEKIRAEGVTSGEFESLKRTYMSRVIFKHETVLALAKRYSKWMSLKNELFDLDTELNAIMGLDYEVFKKTLAEMLNTKRVSVARVGRKREDFKPF